MRPPAPRWLPLVFVLLLAACDGGPEQVPRRVEGVVVEVTPRQGPVRGFSVETAFETYHLLIDPRTEYGFDLRHLDEHRATGDPVLVRVETRAGAAYAVSIDDA